jgi:predicted phosphodiesterase
MDHQKKLKLVKELMERGLGRRRIAKALETTEWEARTLMRIALVPRKRSTKKSDPPKRASRKHSLSNKKKKTGGATTIKAISSVNEDSTPRKIDIKNTNLKVAVLSDIHYPYEDEKSEELTKNFLLDYGPDIIVFNGDITDCYSVSSYQKDIRKKMNIQDELDYAHDKLAEWVQAFPESDFKYLEGNHENRFARIIKNNAPALSALRTLSIEENLGLNDLGIEWLPEWQDLQIGNMMFIHGHMVRKSGGASAKAHFEKYGCSLLMGHCHRLAVTYKRNKYGTHAMVENGTLCDFDVEYARFPDWQQGFTTLEFDGDDFAVYQHPIIDHKLIANGKVYML